MKSESKNMFIWKLMKVAKRAVNFYRRELMGMQTWLGESWCGIKGPLQELGKPCASMKMGGKHGFLPWLGILNGIWTAEGAHRDAGACGSVGADHGPRPGGDWFTSLPWLWMLCFHLEPVPLPSSCHQILPAPDLCDARAACQVLSGLSFHPGR